MERSEFFWLDFEHGISECKINDRKQKHDSEKTIIQRSAVKTGKLKGTTELD